VDPSAEQLSFYAAPGLMTSAGELNPLFAPLPTDIPGLCRVVQGLLIHPLITEWYGVDLTSTQKKEVNIRPVSEILRLMSKLDPRPLSEARPVDERVVGNCRDHAVLFCAMLRHQGRPARVRAGFAVYLSDQMISDHWITEYWDAEQARWVQVDPQIDDLQRKKMNITFDTTHLPAGQFYTGAQAWMACRKGKAKSGKFGHNRKLRGWPYLRMTLLQDIAAISKIEVLPWDNWWELGTKADDQVTAEDRKFLDQIAVALNSDSFDDISMLFDDPRIGRPLLSKLQTLGMNPPALTSASADETGQASSSATVPEGNIADNMAQESASISPAAPTPQSAPVSKKTLQVSDLDRLADLAKAAADGRPAQDIPHATASHPSGNGYAKGNGFGQNGRGHIDPDIIVVRGAQQHNLKHVNVTIPRNKLVVLTGVSGSGKSSLAFDTLYAEGQRRYVESLSAYVRRFLDQMDKPKVDYIGGLSPAISIEQKSVSKNPRSTVGTITEVMDYMRVLFSRAGIQHCPQCGRAINPVSPQVVADRLVQLPPGTRFQLIAPVIRNRKGDHAAALEQARQGGFTRARIDGQLYDLHELKKLPKLLKSQPHTIEIIVDRLVIPDSDSEMTERKDFAARVVDSVETALHTGKGTLCVDLLNGEDLLLTEQNACPHCDLSLPALSPALFSFNAPTGMCPDCNGLGSKMEVDPALIVEHPELSMLDGASRWYGNVRKKGGWHYNNLKTVADFYGVDLELAWKDLPQKFRDVILWGSEDKFIYKWENQAGTWKGEGERQERGAVFHINRLFRQTQSEYTRRWYMSFMSQQPCSTCGGSRLCAEARHATVGGITFPEVLDMTIEDAYAWVCSLSEANGNNGSGLHPSSAHLNTEQIEVVGEVLKELRSRLRFMLDVGLHYLNLSRPAPTLSGGEGQRIRLASQLGCGLVGVLYILDEPSIGLHSRDQRNLLNTLLKLRDMGNTVLVVEHDAETMHAADWLIDLGPGAGIKGGEVVSAGTPAQVAADPQSLTGQYLSGVKQVTAPNNNQRRTPRGWLTLSGARLFNLKSVTARFPLGTVTVVTGVSGSGKSSLVADTLFPALARNLMGAQSTPGPYDRLDGLNQLDKVIDITQEPIGRTPRSNPATYVGVFDDIRQVFAATPEARMRGYGPDRFSFNVKGGRCESCRGHGWKKVEMHFLPDVWVVCQECKGARYNRHTLEVTYKGKNIAETLDMDVQEALEFFDAFPRIHRMLQTLHDVGLDYVKLGQSATTLSGGEAQRVKLAKELGRVATGDTIYILDEPTTGLHFADIQRLLDVLHRLADAGNTVIIIEHNMDVIKTADWLIDLGPEGGAGGGQIIAEGTPEQVAMVEASYTGQFLREELGIKT
jgi:excinuclease ABC subunit A